MCNLEVHNTTTTLKYLLEFTCLVERSVFVHVVPMQSGNLVICLRFVQCTFLQFFSFLFFYFQFECIYNISQNKNCM